MDEDERRRRLRAYGFDDHSAAPTGGPARGSRTGMEHETPAPKATKSHSDVQHGTVSHSDEVPADPLGDPYLRLHRWWMSWVLGDPEIRTDWHRAGRAGWALAAWMFPAFLVLFAGQWVKETYQVEDPLGIVGAIIAGALFVLVWFGGARLTLRWWHDHRE